MENQISNVWLSISIGINVDVRLSISIGVNVDIWFAVESDELPWWIPRTGDAANMLAWLAVLVAAAIGLGGTAYAVKKKYRLTFARFQTRIVRAIQSSSIQMVYFQALYPLCNVNSRY